MDYPENDLQLQDIPMRYAKGLDRKEPRRQKPILHAISNKPCLFYLSKKLLAFPFCCLYGWRFRASMQGFAAGWTFRGHQLKRGVAARALIVNLLLFHDFSLHVLLVLGIFILCNKVNKKWEHRPLSLQPTKIRKQRSLPSQGVI